MTVPSWRRPLRIRQVAEHHWHLDGLDGQYEWPHLMTIVSAIYQDQERACPIALLDGRIFLMLLKVGGLAPTDPLYRPEDYPSTDRQLQ
jgi:hypothetical protein